MSIRPLLMRTLLAFGLAGLLVSPASAAPAKRAGDGGGVLAQAGINLPVTQIKLVGSAVVNMADLARREALMSNASKPPVRVLDLERNEHEGDRDAEYNAPNALGLPPNPAFIMGQQLNIASPAPQKSFAGLDDIAMVDSSYIIIPPDVNGAVGPTKIFQNLNNNVRIIDKATGAVLSTVGVNTWWAGTGASANNYTDPRSTYDPIQGRFITITQGDLDKSTANSLCVGLSDTNDPSGTWHLYRFVLYENATTALADFPTLGFNKNWITVCINMYRSTGSTPRTKFIAIHYPSLLANTFTAFVANQTVNNLICGAPAQTYSATSDTEYVLQRAGTSTIYVHRITGTGPAAPTITISATAITRTGGAWASGGSGQLLPQSQPVSGTSTCGTGTSACKIELADDNIRTPPVYRNGQLWFAQTVYLPSTSSTHAGVQWTQLATQSASPYAAFVTGGRLEDTGATSTNGRPWFAFPQIAVNSNQDFLLGFTRFSSSQHPGAAYAMHVNSDGVGTLRDTVVYQDGLDYYHKTFSATRNRWGDFSTAQVDPSDDLTLWTVQEYAKARTSTDDGTTGSNGSKWGTWWAAVTPVANTFIVTATTGANGTISPVGNVPVNQGSDKTFTITPASCYHIADVLVDGVSQGAIATYTFTNVQANHTISATFAVNSPFTITASAGANGSITPSGAVSVACGGTQAFTIAPASCYHVADVQVDGVSQGAITTYTFTNTQANHTISATFAINGPYTVTASAGANGSITPAGATVLTCGASQAYTIAADPCYHIVSVLVDGVSQGAITSYTFSNVTANHTISATFAINTYTLTASAGANGSISPVGVTTLNCGANQTYTLTANSGYYLSSLLVDGSPVTPAPTYTFSNVQANHTIAASFAIDVATIAAMSSTTVLCPTNTCVTLPVTLARNGGTPVLGYSVTFQLSPELTLCSGNASITEGSFLNSSGSTLLNIVNHGGGLYTVDDALTANCGPTATSGTLFTLGVASTSPGGPGTITVTSLKLRDCSNAVLTTAAGPAATVPIDNAAPVVTVTSPNGGEAMLPGNTFPITWTATDNVGVANVDIAYSTDGGATYPNTIAMAIPNSGSYSWTVPNLATSDARVRVTAHDVNCSSGQDASDANFAIGGSIVGPVGPTTCLTPANSCVTVPVNIARSDATGLRLFHVDFTLSPNLKLCGTTAASVLQGTYLTNVNTNTTFFVLSNGGGSYTADGTINGTPCGATAPTGNLFNVKVAANGGSGTGTVTVNAVTLRDCVNNNLVPASAGPPATITIDTAPVTIAAIPTPQTVIETNLLTITPTLTLSSCATGPATWTVSPALPAGATFSTTTGVITWTPACGTVGTYGPFTLTATASSGDAATTNAFTIDVTYKVGTVVVAAIPTPQTVVENSLLTITPSATLTSCATGPLAWAVSPVLPAGATFSTTTGVITWTPACGTVNTYGPFTLTATAATGEVGTSNTFSINVTHLAGTVTVAAITTPQTVVENSLLTITPSATLTSCAAGPEAWSVSPALPAGATFSTSTGVITWTPACGTAGTFGPFTLTATAATGEVGASNPFTIDVTHLAGTVTVAAIPTPQTVAETNLLTITPSATLTACAASPVTWSVALSVSPNLRSRAAVRRATSDLPAGATFDPATGVITWTPACGTVGTYGPFTLTATAATGETGSSNPFTIVVTHNTGSVVVATIATPQTVVEQSTLTITPSATLTACAAGPETWSVSPALPAGATFSTSTGVITWTPACGTVNTYGPFTLTATAATGEVGSSNPFAIDVTHLVGTVTVAAIGDPQTVAELALLTITPSATLTSCATGPLAWSVSPALPSGAVLSTSTGVITWTPDCAAAEGGTAGTYGPFTLTATAATLEVGSSNPFSIHVTDTPVAIGAPTVVTASQVLTGNVPGDTTGIVVHFTAPAGAATYKVYRAPFGFYPYYDDAGGAVPAQPTVWPPASPWQLTLVTTEGGTDIPPARDYWYYVVYAANACGDISVASTMTTGTLDYDLGDVTNGFVHGFGDNLVQTEDISELGANYGISLGTGDPLGYLDVGPTTTHYVDGRPLTDKKVNFEDLVMFAINYGHVSSPAMAAKASPNKGGAAAKEASTDLLVLASPDQVVVGNPVNIPIKMQGSGAIQALSIRLSWDPAVVTPTGHAAGDLLSQLDGVAMSATPGSVDAAVLGAGRGVSGQGELASVTFKVITGGDPKIRIESVDARDTHNRAVSVNTSREVLAPELPKITGLQGAMPNPFRQTVSLAIGLTHRDPVELSVFSVDGRRVRTLASGVYEAGTYRFSWDGRDERGNAMSAGVYYARLTAGQSKFTKTLVLLK